MIANKYLLKKKHDNDFNNLNNGNSVNINNNKNNTRNNVNNCNNNNSMFLITILIKFSIFIKANKQVEPIWINIHKLPLTKVKSSNHGINHYIKRLNNFPTYTSLKVTCLAWVKKLKVSDVNLNSKSNLMWIT